MLPDSQPQSAPEIALIQRMILGKTVDDLNLQTLVKEKYFPLFGEGWAKLTGQKPQSISVSRFYIGEIDNNDET
jgi:tyrosine-protein kinase Etk/Wzc